MKIPSWCRLEIGTFPDGIAIVRPTCVHEHSIRPLVVVGSRVAATADSKVEVAAVGVEVAGSRVGVVGSMVSAAGNNSMAAEVVVAEDSMVEAVDSMVLAV